MRLFATIVWKIFLEITSHISTFGVTLCSKQLRDAAVHVLRVLRVLTLSKALSAKQARTYHAREFTSEKQNYWSRDRQGHSEWQGELARDWALHGSVDDEQFARLSEGQHPESAVQLVRHQPAKTYENEYGKQITSAEHRAGWDATFSAPKSVSLTALVVTMDACEAHIVKVFVLRFMNWNATRRLASATSMHLRQRVSSSQQPSSMTRRGLLTDMRHRSFTHML
jgi:hypothetical protein